jgi:hypothetical protein
MMPYLVLDHIIVHHIIDVQKEVFNVCKYDKLGAMKGR